MKWLLKLIFVLLLLSGAALCQAHTQVSGLVRDPAGNIYVNCTFSVNFIGQSTEPGPYLLQGSVFQQNFAGVRCDGLGNFSITLPANNAIFPQPSSWAFHFCDTSGRFCNSLNSLVITIAGQTQDISAQIEPVMPILAGGAGGWNPPLANGGTIFGNNTLSTTTPRFFVPGGDVSFSTGNFWVNSLHFGPTNLFLQNTGLTNGNCLQVSGGTNLIGGPCGTTGVTSFAGRNGVVTPQASDYSAFFQPIGAVGAVSSVFGRTGDITASSGDYTCITTATCQITGAAPLAAPAFTGVPTAPTAAAGNNTTQLATTAFVIANRGALLASPAFTGTPTAPTAPLGTNTTQLATTAFVLANQSPGGVTSFNTRTGAITPEAADYSSFFAPISINGTLTNLSVGGLSPLFTTNVTNSTTTPSVAFTITQAPAGTMLGNSGATAAAPNWISIPQSGVTSVFTRTGQVAAQAGDYAAFYPPINNAHLTGTPTATTVGNTDNSTSIATTAWVRAQGFTTAEGGGNATGLIFPASPTNVVIPIGSPAPTAGQFLTFNGSAIVGGSPSGAPVSSVFTRTGNVVANSADYAAYYLPITNAAMLGNPTAPTPASADNSTSIATTAWVKSQNYGTGNVASVFGRSGAVTADAADYAAFYAPITSPNFLGTPTAPTAAAATNNTQIATTAFVRSLGYAPLASPVFTGNPTAPSPAITAAASQSLANTNYVQQYVAANTINVTGGTGSANTIPRWSAARTLVDSNLEDNPTTGFLTYTGSGGMSLLASVPAGDSSSRVPTTNWVMSQGFAPLASPNFTGIPTAPTAALSTNTTQLATTAFVIANRGALLASPAFTGTPTAPTATAGTNTTQLATTAFVLANSAGVTTGNTGYIPLWTGGNLIAPTRTLTNSALMDNLTTLSYGGTGGITSAGPITAPSITGPSGTSVTTVTPELNDESNNIATTKWVKDQGYGLRNSSISLEPLNLFCRGSAGAVTSFSPTPVAIINGQTGLLMVSTQASGVTLQVHDNGPNGGNSYIQLVRNPGDANNGTTVLFGTPINAAVNASTLTITSSAATSMVACLTVWRGIVSFGNTYALNSATATTTAQQTIPIQEPYNFIYGGFSLRGSFSQNMAIGPGNGILPGISSGANQVSLIPCVAEGTDTPGNVACGITDTPARFFFGAAVELRGTLGGLPPCIGASGSICLAAQDTRLISAATSIPTTLLCASLNCRSGIYEVLVYLNVSEACPGGTYSVTLHWNDAGGLPKSNTLTWRANTGATGTAMSFSSINNYAEQSQVIYSNGINPISFSTTAVACSSGTGTGLLAMTVRER